MKRISLILLLISLAITSIYAQGTTFNGFGTESDPYLVENIQDLITISESTSLWSSHFLQTADIDASSTLALNDGAGFSPISNVDNHFTGSYDGQGHTINNLYINRPSTWYIGLFGFTEYAEISNLGIVDANISGHYHVGGLVGYARESTISNSYATGAVTGNDKVGGLVGYAYTSATISNSYATGDVSGSVDYIGGLVGYSRESTISNSYATGAVSGRYKVGGLVGSAYTSATISNSYATGDVSGYGYTGGLVGYASISATISYSYATGAVSGITSIGGLVGYAYSFSSISNSYATGAVSGSDDYIGGLVGNLTNSSTISNSYATGDVSGGDEAIGGLVGFSRESTISNSYATGDVSGGDEAIGGLVGYAYSSSNISNSYATGDVSGRIRSGGLVGYASYSSTISNSYATGVVTGYIIVGGLVGNLTNSSTISNSYATGAVTGNDKVGGLVGYAYDSTISNSFWDTETSGQTSSAGGTGKTTTEMQDINIYVNAQWDFVDETANGQEEIWSIDSGRNDGYPYLTWAEEYYPILADFPENVDTEIDDVMIQPSVDLNLDNSVDENHSLITSLPNYENLGNKRVIGLTGFADDIDIQVTAPAGNWYGKIYYRGSWHSANPIFIGETDVDRSFTFVGVDFTAKDGEVIIFLNDGEDSTLPIELSSFNAVITSANYAQINWETASESNLLGYNIYRAESDNEDEALRLTATMIQATNSAMGESYSYTDDEVEMNTTYNYWLQANDFNGTTEMFGPVSVKISDDQNHDIEDITFGTQLFGNYPNPFNPSTIISFSVAEPQVVTIEIYNMKGQLVKRLLNDRVETPNVRVNAVWNGADDNNNKVASGIYLYKLVANKYHKTNKMILMK